MGFSARMRSEKKLKQGLPELSPLFSKSGSAALLPRYATVVADDPARRSPLATGPLQLMCGSFVSFSEGFGVKGILQLTETLSSTFEDIFYLALDPTKARYETLGRTMSLPFWNQIIYRSDIHLEVLRRHLTFGFVPSIRLHDVMHPPVAANGQSNGPGAEDDDANRKSLAIVDLARYDHLTSARGLGRTVYELLDYCILAVEADSEQLTRAYTWLRRLARENPALRVLFLLVGKSADKHWEFVYERFHAISANFLTRDLGFLGWLDDENQRINSDILIEETGGATQRSTKARLSEALYRPMLVQCSNDCLPNAET